jgi:hypothetical protein
MDPPESTAPWRTDLEPLVERAQASSARAMQLLPDYLTVLGTSGILELVNYDVRQGKPPDEELWTAIFLSPDPAWTAYQIAHQRIAVTRILEGWVAP